MAYIYSLADTWNASGTTFTGIGLNVTDTASASGSLLMDLQVGGTSQFKVSKGGTVTTAALYAPTIYVAGVIGGDGMWWNSGTLNITGTSRLRFGEDLDLRRDAANTLAQRNGVNAQAFNLYNTYTDASNYERGFMRWSSNVLEIGAEEAGTGTARALEFQTDGVTRLTIASTGLMTSTQRLIMNVSAPTAIGTPILRIGGATYGTNGFYGVGFGYGGSPTKNMPIEIGMDETSSTGETFGDFYVATRSVTTDTAPSIRLKVTAAGKLELSDTIKTAAPTGGTSAEWRLGTVASGTPTLPNRTIEVDIGGTIYYLHAKTTND